MTLTEAEKHTALGLHNQARTAVNLPPLTYCPKLAAHAQEWAGVNMRAGRIYHSDLESRRVPSANRLEQIYEGENIAESCRFVGPGLTVGEATQMWLAEKRNIRNGKATGIVGHYTQIIYEKCTKVGFGLARSGATVYVVARYDKIQTELWAKVALTFTGPSSKPKTKTRQGSNLGSTQNVVAPAPNRAGDPDRVGVPPVWTAFAGWHGQDPFATPAQSTLQIPTASNTTGQGSKSSTSGAQAQAKIQVQAQAKAAKYFAQSPAMRLSPFTGVYTVPTNMYTRTDEDGNVFRTMEGAGVATVTKTTPDGKVTTLTGAEAARELGRARKGKKKK